MSRLLRAFSPSRRKGAVTPPVATGAGRPFANPLTETQLALGIGGDGTPSLAPASRRGGSPRGTPSAKAAAATPSPPPEPPADARQRPTASVLPAAAAAGSPATTPGPLRPPTVPATATLRTHPTIFRIDLGYNGVGGKGGVGGFGCRAAAAHASHS